VAAKSRLSPDFTCIDGRLQNFSGGYTPRQPPRRAHVTHSHNRRSVPPISRISSYTPHLTSAAGSYTKPMKIVLAEKVSPATLAVLKAEPDWNVVTADAIAKLGPGGLESELADADALVV